ncbi:MAG: pyridoxal kinase PdxY [Proteobacteria bacterium]|nr:pyridoxal kinase PdxY [Pseudomonadota bacterium]
MKRILSIQSHVAHGYVGNRAAVFPLQRMGFDVTAINTVQFSNHPGYGSWTGDVFSETHIRNLINGLRALGVLYSFDAVLSGYLGDASLGNVILETVAEIKAHNPACLYCCDPVMGDVGRGLFVKPDIPALFRDKASRIADIMTPNLFELEQLTGTTILSLEEARKACVELHTAGVNTVLVTSLMHNAGPSNTVQMMTSSKKGDLYSITTPYLNLTPMPNGTGDLTTALYLGYILGGHSDQKALERTCHGIYSVLEATKGRELCIIENQDTLMLIEDDSRKPRFSATAIP